MRSILALSIVLAFATPAFAADSAKPADKPADNKAAAPADKGTAAAPADKGTAAAPVGATKDDKKSDGPVATTPKSAPAPAEAPKK